MPDKETPAAETAMEFAARLCGEDLETFKKSLTNSPLAKMKPWDYLETVADLTEPIQDFRIVGLVYRKWYNPMRYIKGKQILNKCIVQLVP